MKQKIAVIGLGYVGLPLAVALARHVPCVGFDINGDRVAELRSGYDATREVADDVLRASSLVITDQLADVADADIFIVTVPTPVDGANQPDLSPVRAASRTVGRCLKPGRGQIVIYESTVYPGVTEDICGPILEAESGLTCGADFFLGYSPERINPGDKEHTVERITKVVSGQTPEVLETIAALYDQVTTGGVFRAASIKVAEAAKVIENAQRDINIAFMNEIAQIFARVDISVYDVLDAARTKWNFLPFSPGLVGGHCIGVDPYYLSYLAAQVGHRPDVILAGRNINDAMGRNIADAIHDQLRRPSHILVLGLTFKEDVPDLRNSRVVDIIERLQWIGHDVTVHDPLAKAEEAQAEYAIALDPDALDGRYDAVVAAVPHATYRDLSDAAISALVGGAGLVADIKGMWRDRTWSAGLTRWQL